MTGTSKDGERSRLFYEAFLHGTDAILVTDRSGTIVDVNPAFERTYGYPRAECLGRTARLVKSPRTPRSLYERMWKDILDPAKGHWSGEMVNLDKARREHPVRLTIDAVRNANGDITHFVGVAADLTERRAWERQAEHAERLASIGQLAAGVAHEINTPLASILLIVEKIRMRNTDASIIDLLATLESQVDAASRIVRGLLDFSREPVPSSGPVNVVDVAREAVAFLRGKFGTGVEVRETYAAPTLEVRGDRDEIHQLFVNILKNAYDALAGTGHIDVTIGSREGTVEFTISDDGPGIPADIQPRIFDPFFTTKPPGQGTGLGLAICHAIAVRHGGDIEVQSQEGKGTAFRVHLPTANEASRTRTLP